eukprot:XP_014767776.1 PREDICTED: uncharacterized protein LOC106867420 isoform X2 [Octopus bimaculoides]
MNLKVSCRIYWELFGLCGLSYKEVINKRKLLQYSYIFQALCHVVMMMVVMVHQVPQSPITHSQLKHRFSVALTAWATSSKEQTV